MHDLDHDRLTLRRTAYLRVKLLRLAETYEQFLMETLPRAPVK